MDTLEAILTRRSIRAYTDRPVPASHVRQLMQAAFTAPSAFDERPWHFILLTDRERLQQLGGAMPGCEMLQQATLGLLICGDERLEKFPGLWVQDCSACAENVLLAAHALGLGAVWLALHPIEDRIRAVREACGVPGEVTPFALISMGFPAESLPGENRWDDSRLHDETWNA